MAKSGRGSCIKGKTYELKIAKAISEALKCDFRRTPSPERWKTHKGDGNAPVWQKSIVHDYTWEMKKRESGNVINWYKKVKEENEGLPKKPVVVFSKNHEDDYVLLSLKDWLSLLKETDGWRKEAEE